MSLLSKRTFRKWAKALTERGLTVDDADVVAEIGNTVYVKGSPAPLEGTSITVGFNFVSFTVGAVWLNGAAFTYPFAPPGTTGTLTFSPGTESDLLVYCFVPYIGVTDYRPTTPISPPGDEIPNWQVIRVDKNGDVALEIIPESEVTPEYETQPSIVDPDTGLCSAGWVRRLLLRLTKNPTNAQWYATIASQSPEELLIFNIQSLNFDNQIVLTSSVEIV